jgi:copper chaperone NosL
MKSRVSRVLGPVAALVVLVVIAACNHPAAIDPPPIQYGEDVCEFCRMTIDNVRFAAALIYRTPAGRQRVAIFDDIGCMLAWQREHSTDRTIAAFVHDFKTHQWIKASGAWYVRSSAIQTPMGWGIAAGASRADAAQSAPGSGLKPMDFNELRSAEKPGQGTTK